MWSWLMCPLGFWVSLTLEGILLVCAGAGKEPGACESEERQKGRKWESIRSNVRQACCIVKILWEEWKVMWLVPRHFSKLRCEATAVEVWLHYSPSLTLLELPCGTALPPVDSAVSPACASVILSGIQIEVAKYCDFFAGSVPWSGMLLVHIMASTSTKQELQLSGTVCLINKICVDCSYFFFLVAVNLLW